MIHSTMAGNEASWIDPIPSPDANKSFEYAFSSMSLSSVLGGNRPPALSTSSISSFGEESTHQKLHNSYNNSNNNNHNSSSSSSSNGHLSYAPPSPLTPSSSRNHFASSVSINDTTTTTATATSTITTTKTSTTSKNTLSSPIIGRHDDSSRGINNNFYGESPSSSSIRLGSPMIQTAFEDTVNEKKEPEQQQQQQQLLGFQRENSSSSITRGFSDLSNKQNDRGLWSPRQGQDFSSKVSKGQIRSVSSDTSDESPFGSWPPHNNVIMSPGNRSTHSLQNMGSVDENEQFLGNRNRARTLSAGAGGYRNVHTFGRTGADINSPLNTQVSEHQYLNNFMDGSNHSHHQHDQHGLSAGHVNGQHLPSPHTHNHNHNQQFHGQSGGQQHIGGRVNNFPFGHGSNIIREDLVHAHSHNELPAAMKNNHYVRTGTRQRVMSADAINRGGLGGMYRQTQMPNQSPIMPQARVRPSSAGDAQYNRPRSHSSSAIGHGMSPRHFVDAPSTLSDGRGKYFTHMHANDNRYPILPSIQQKLMSEEEAMMRMNGTLLHSHSIQESIGSNSPNHNMVDSYHYYPSHGVRTNCAPRVIYTVKFKRSQRNFVLCPHIQGDIKIGTHVKVEADRGEDLGVVLSRVPAEKFNHNMRALRYNSTDPVLSSPGVNMPEMKRILSVATSDEITLLQIKNEEEDELLKICRGKTLQRGLPMNVVDAEYQFDRHKLTFFFEAEGRIDFRELVRELFSIYKTRIWMQQIDKNSAIPVSALNIATATSAVNEDSDGASSEKSEDSNKEAVKH